MSFLSKHFLSFIKSYFMKTLFFILALSVSAMAQSSDTLYCIQIMSTKTPQYIRAEHLAMCTLDQAMVEQTDSLYRIMFVYDTFEEAEIMLTTWKRAHKDAFICRRTRKQVSQYFPFVTKL
jgi:hypothetical protein